MDHPAGAVIFVEAAQVELRRAERRIEGADIVDVGIVDPVPVQQRAPRGAPFPSSCRCVSQGIEFYAQPTFDIRVGYQANLTFNDTNTAAVVLNGREIAESPLVGSAENQANFTLFYENDRFLARASHNRRGEVVNGAHNQLTIYTET